MLGADVGTAADVTDPDVRPVVALSAADFSRGDLLPVAQTDSRLGSSAESAIGLGLIILALQLIVEAAAPITQAAGVKVIVRVTDWRYSARRAWSVRCSR
jgi:phosphate:Na+ symporter